VQTMHDAGHMMQNVVYVVHPKSLAGQAEAPLCDMPLTGQAQLETNSKFQC